jgi:F-type H+-transporting ATPase subunit gamma
MKTYQSFRNQDKGFRDVLETVKAAEKIAASSVHFLRQEADCLNKYAEEIRKIMERLTEFVSDTQNPLLTEKKTGLRAIVLLAADKGLVDGLWHSMVNALLDRLGDYDFFIAIGQKGQKYLREEKIAIDKSFDQLENDGGRKSRDEVTEYLFSGFINGKFSKVDILFPRFISISEHEPAIVPYLPFSFRPPAERQNIREAPGFPIFDPSKKTLFHDLLKKHIELFFTRIVHETTLSELSARTVAMEHARVKTDRLIQKITFDFLKERRQIATQRQLESFTAHNTL